MAMLHYTGSCQCGGIAFEVDADLDSTFICNCSRCRRLGSVFTFAAADAVHFTREVSTEYRFNRKVLAHHFCPVCGIETHATGENDGKLTVAINANCLDGVDPRALPSKVVDGASF